MITCIRNIRDASINEISNKRKYLTRQNAQIGVSTQENQCQAGRVQGATAGPLAIPLRLAKHSLR